MEQKLVGWKRLYLSKGGIITLIKSILLNSPTYFLSLFSVPASVATYIERLHRNFIWSGFGKEFKYHLVKWNKVCSPISYGGLAIRNLRVFNRVFLKKRLWLYNMEPETLWKSVLDFKYGGLWGRWSTRDGYMGHVV